MQGQCFNDGKFYIKFSFFVCFKNYLQREVQKEKICFEFGFSIDNFTQFLKEFQILQSIDKIHNNIKPLEKLL